jgi:outer membrane protein assembly factor BamE
MFRALLSALSALALAGCASHLQTSETLFGLITPYRMEIVQGNVITKEQMERLKVGMPRRQVVDLLGSPLVADIFHGDRWDYVFTIRRQGAEPQLRRIVARFDGDLLKSLDASSELPAEREFVASIDTFKTSRKAPPLALSEEQVKALPVPPKPPAAAAEPVGPTRSFPPLEPAK